MNEPTMREILDAILEFRKYFEAQFDAIDRRFDAIDQRFDRLEARNNGGEQR